MEEKYIKETALVEISEIEKEEEIIKNIVKAKNDLEAARRNFEYARQQ